MYVYGDSLCPWHQFELSFEMCFSSKFFKLLPCASVVATTDAYLPFSISFLGSSRSSTKNTQKNTEKNSRHENKICCKYSK